VVRRYYQGWAADRSYAYWVWANLAALLLSAGPVAGPALARTLRPALAEARARIAALTRGSARTTAATDADTRATAPADVRPGPAVWLPLAAALTVAAADVSGLAKAEVERIWLSFAVWLLVAVARLPPGDRRWWLAGQAVTALAVNHLLWTVS
jgi:hypothetical protein